VADVLTQEQRRLNMSRIRGSDTKPEKLVRSALHAMGLRFRLHDRTLPGTPDIVLKRHRTVVFVNGCFWHGHGCKLSKMPATRAEFWTSKIGRTKARDAIIAEQLLDLGWNVVVVWECALRNRRGDDALQQTWRTLRRAVARCRPTLTELTTPD
jgi:DNA mismatch endonuclease (patch repair protein)